MNQPLFDMIIEQNTNYAYKVKHMENPTFDMVRNLAIKLYRELPNQLLNRGVDSTRKQPIKVMLEHNIVWIVAMNMEKV